MSENIKEIFVRIEYLEKLINSIQQWVILTWGILAVIVAVLSVTITILVKKWVDKKVEEELPKAIEANPPILYFTGMLNKISTTRDDKNNWHTKARIELDCKKFKLKALNFPVELNLYYVESRNFKDIILNSENGLDNTWSTNTYKVPIIQYTAEISNNVIQIKYIEYKKDESLTDTAFYTLKIPNPIYQKDIKQN
ncbi:hypothetical protein [Clostridium botulinum]|uniref:hypothetical protein n=1 Tax=Clostridium botulinum TaxID=1491 RepID=UPI001C9B153A|nr:hypothetical protein [Clostridium botulinum]MBY6967506.1 hypothetical protein [Clostridium botulinum]